MRLVDADEAKAKVRSTFDMQDLYLPYRFQNMLDEMPTVDAVEVVRCKDCRWLENDGYHTRCRITGLSVEAEDYCNRGERRKDGTN